MTEPDTHTNANGLRNRRVAARLAPPAALVLLGLCLYVPGLNWGLPNTDSWSQDTIAGIRTVNLINTWPDNWRGRYTPLHYFVNYAAYLPTLSRWDRTGECVVDATTDRRILKPPYAPKISLLIERSRWISVLMACATGLGLWAAARVLTNNEWVSVIAAATMMIGASFTYFAHLGNVDIPTTCWFAWSLFFYARALGHRHGLDCILLGLFASLAVCTKLGTAGVYPGMALVLLATEIRHRKSSGRLTGEAIPLGLFQWKWLLGLVAFALPFMYINGIFHNWEAYITRMRYWLDPTLDTIHARQHRYPNQLSLVLASIRYAVSAVGWPMVVAMAVSTVYALRRHTRTALILLAPAITYYIVVITSIHFVYARFLFPILALLGILVGMACVDLLRSRRVPVTVRYLIPLVVALPTVGYAVAVDLEMVTDSRYQAERWLQANVDPLAEVGVFSKPQYLPRVNHMGYSVYKLTMSRKTFETPQPEYLLLTSYNYDDFDEPAQACKKDLVDGRLGYQPIAVFGRRFLGFGGSWLSLAGWGTERPGKISPTIVILKRGHVGPTTL